MNLSVPNSARIAVLASAIVYTIATFAFATSTPVAAQSGPYYSATLSQPTEDDRAIAGGIAWACKGTTCVANKGSSRPARICRSLSREMGEIAEFRANGETLDEAELARCNGK